MTTIGRAHGTGGRSSHLLIEEVFRPLIGGPLLSPDDAATIALRSGAMVVTTDVHVVEPIQFPGGDIGKLAITGVVNDLLTRGAQPRFLTLGFILEEGLLIATLREIVASIGAEMSAHGIALLCADTKVIPARGQPGMMIASTLFGTPLHEEIPLPGPKVGDALLLSGPLGSHGLALLVARESLPFRTTILSDCTSLYAMIAPLFSDREPLHYLRDVTRGGLAGILHELSKQFSVGFELDERAIPVLPTVRAGLTFLGIDPLEVANEGVMLLVVPADQAERLRDRLKAHPQGERAAIVGTVVERGLAPLVVRTEVGGRRAPPWPEALALPRIC